MYLYRRTHAYGPDETRLPSRVYKYLFRTTCVGAHCPNHAIFTGGLVEQKKKHKNILEWISRGGPADERKFCAPLVYFSLQAR